VRGEFFRVGIKGFHTALLPGREKREEFNREIIAKYNEKQPDEPVDAAMYGAQKQDFDNMTANIL